MSEKKLERDLLKNMVEAEIEKQKVEQEIEDLKKDPTQFFKNLYVENIWQVNLDHDQIRERALAKKLAEKQLLENKKKLFEELGLKWDKDIVNWIEEDRYFSVTFFNHVPNTEVPDRFKKRAELLASYINAHSKLGDLL